MTEPSEPEIAQAAEPEEAYPLNPEPEPDGSMWWLKNYHKARGREFSLNQLSLDLDRGYTLGNWKAYPMFQCTRCGHSLIPGDSYNAEQEIQIHADRHKLLDAEAAAEATGTSKFAYPSGLVNASGEPL